MGQSTLIKINQALPFFLSGIPMLEIAEIMGVGIATVYRWNKHPVIVQAKSKQSIDQQVDKNVFENNKELLLDSKYIQNAIDRQRWWTQIILDDSVLPAIRMKASELLAKAQGDFVDRVRIEKDLEGEIQGAIAKIAALEPELGAHVVKRVLDALASALPN